ncbi:hypothetical protein VTJ49DRAFT_3776 [Mycothermus thermophilus]|uniref:Histone-lysine N-methyltransferase n=1 Tax=Humicola insolens TaxID=85995 RepID=A0ABR3V6Q2_HUMIN
MASIEAPSAMADIDSMLCAGASFASATPTDASSSTSSSSASSSNAMSLSSTPPTSHSPDSMSLASEPDLHAKPDTITAATIEAAIARPESPIHDEQSESSRQTSIGEDAIVVAEPTSPLPEPPAVTTRPRRARASLPVYNIAKLAGTDVHGRRRSKGDVVQEKRRRTIATSTEPSELSATAPEPAPIPAPDASATALEPSKSGRPGRGARSVQQSRTSPRKAKEDALTARRASAGPLHTPKSGRITKKTPASAPPAHLTRRATRLSGLPVENLTVKLATLTQKKGKKSADKGLSRLPRELLRLRDTNEFAGIDTRPVKYTVWSNGKYVDVDPTKEEIPATIEPPRKRAKVDEKTASAEASSSRASASASSSSSSTEKPEAKEQQQEQAAPPPKKPRAKKWLEKGLYAGQEAPLDIFKGLTAQEKKKLAALPELLPSGKPNRTFPMPMYNGLRILINGRDFKLPYDVCNPLPPGQPKPAAYRTMTKNRFVGNAASIWKKMPHFYDSASKCVCTPEDGCGDDCQNRIMLYECDETNCNLGPEHCKNRAFQDLAERTKKGGRYRIGVEVFKTEDRGYGVRANRCFDSNQIIMEYTGEIITVEECERRMNEEYKDNECYYLMSFDQNMIIDATTGSIARFVNHSCAPNCRMIKWIVGGQPRMALFAGDRPIMTGEELTYDYNFDPFSAKNVQKCLCGSSNCRGVLGPKPREVKQPKKAKEYQVAVAAKGKAGKGAKAAKVSPVKVTVSGSPKKVSKTTTKTATKPAAVKKPATKAAAKTTTKSATKRKLKDAFEFDGDDEADNAPAKKRKIKVATGAKKTGTSAASKATKGTVIAVKGPKPASNGVKKSLSTAAAKKKTTLASKGKKVTKIPAKGMAGKVVKARAPKPKSTTAAAKKATTTKLTKGAAKKTAKTTAKVTAPLRETSNNTAAATKKTIATPPKLKQTKIVFPSRSPSLTIVAAGVASPSSSQQTKKTPTKTTTPSGSASIPRLTLATKTSSRKVTPSRKALEAAQAAAAVAVTVGAAGSPGMKQTPTPRIKVVPAGSTKGVNVAVAAAGEADGIAVAA